MGYNSSELRSIQILKPEALVAEVYDVAEKAD